MRASKKSEYTFLPCACDSTLQSKVDDKTEWVEICKLLFLKKMALKTYEYSESFKQEDIIYIKLSWTHGKNMLKILDMVHFYQTFSIGFRDLQGHAPTLKRFLLTKM